MKTYKSKGLLMLLCLVVLTCTISCTTDEPVDTPDVEANQGNPDAGDSEDTDTTGGDDSDSSDNSDNSDTAENNAIEQEILSLVNTHRASLGLASLEFHTLCNALAEEHTLYMIDQGEISHDNFSDRAQRIFDGETGVVRVAENVAYRYRNAQEVFDAWLGSDGHRANIEAQFTHIGISALADTSGTYYYTQLFLNKN